MGVDGMTFDDPRRLAELLDTAASTTTPDTEARA